MDGPDVSLGFWRCGTGPDSHLIGRGAVGEREPGFYAIGHTEHGLIAWDMRPGSVAETPQIRSATVESPESPATTDDAGIDAGSDAGTPDAGLDASQPDMQLDSGSDAATNAPDAQVDAGSGSDAGTSPIELGPGVIQITEEDSPVSVVNRLSDGLVLRTEQGQHILQADGQFELELQQTLSLLHLLGPGTYHSRFIGTRKVACLPQLEPPLPRIRRRPA